MINAAWGTYRTGEIRRALREVVVQELPPPPLPGVGLFALRNVQTMLLPQALLEAVDHTFTLRITYAEWGGGDDGSNKPVGFCGNLDILQTLKHVQIQVPADRLRDMEVLQLDWTLPACPVYHTQQHRPGAQRGEQKPPRAGLRGIARRVRRRAPTPMRRLGVAALLREREPELYARVLQSLSLAPDDDLHVELGPASAEAGLFCDEQLEALLEALGVRPVYLEELRTVAGGRTVLAPGLARTVLAYLLPGESLHLKCWATKGSAVMNGLFKKGLVTPRLESKVRLSANVGYEVWACCPAGVFDVEDSCKTPANAAAALDWLVEVESYGSETPRQLLEQCWGYLRECQPKRTRAPPANQRALHESFPAYQPASPAAAPSSPAAAPVSPLYQQSSPAAAPGSPSYQPSSPAAAPGAPGSRAAPAAPPPPHSRVHCKNRFPFFQRKRGAREGGGGEEEEYVPWTSSSSSSHKRRRLEALAARGDCALTAFLPHWVSWLTFRDQLALLRLSPQWRLRVLPSVQPQLFLRRALTKCYPDADIEPCHVEIARRADCLYQPATTLKLSYCREQPGPDSLQPRRLELLRLALHYYTRVTELDLTCDAVAAGSLLTLWHGRGGLRTVTLQLYDGYGEEQDRRLDYELLVRPALVPLLPKVQELSLDSVHLGPGGLGALFPAGCALVRLSLRRCKSCVLFGPGFEGLAPTLEELQIYEPGGADAVPLPVSTCSTIWPRLHTIALHGALTPQELVDGLAQSGQGLQWDPACTPALRHYELTVGKRAEAKYVLAGLEAAGGWEGGLLERLRLALCPRGRAPAFLQLRLLCVDARQSDAADLRALQQLASCKMTIVDRGRPPQADDENHSAGALLAHCLGDDLPRQLRVLLGLPPGHFADAERARLRAWSASLRRVFTANSCSGRKVWFRSFPLVCYLPEEPRFDLRELLEVQRSCWHCLCSLTSPVHCAQLWLLDGESSRRRTRWRCRRRRAASSRSCGASALLKGQGSWAEKSGLVSRALWTWLVCSGLLPGAPSGEPLALLHWRRDGQVQWQYAVPWFAKAEKRRLLLNYAVMIWTVLMAVARAGGQISREDKRLLELRRVLDRLKRERRLVAQLAVLLDAALSQAYDEASWLQIHTRIWLPLKKVLA
eukprot:g73209.t1